MDIAAYPVLVAVFHRQGCGACEEFLPRAREAAERWRSCVPTAFLDTDRNDGLSNVMAVQYTPTLFLLREGRIVRRLEGSASSEDMESAYQHATRECRP